MLILNGVVHPMDGPVIPRGFVAFEGEKLTAVGPMEALPAGAPVFDLIYAPLETALLARARELGHPAHNGLSMLLCQAVFALEHFTGVSIDAPAMARRLMPLLGA